MSPIVAPWTLYWAGVALCVVALALALVGELRERPLWKFIFKPLASLGFLIAAAAHFDADRPFAVAVLAGLSLSAIGDVALMWRQRPAFLAGLLAFLAGHVAYIVAFALRGAAAEVTGNALLPLAVVAVVFLRWLLPKVEAKLRLPVVAYVTVISVMVACAIGSHALLPNPLIPLGALLFWASDISVAIDRFVTRSALNRALGLPCYYAGQLTLAAALGAG